MADPPSLVARVAPAHFIRDKLDLFLQKEGKRGTVFFPAEQGEGASWGAQGRFLPSAGAGTQLTLL